MAAEGPGTDMPVTLVRALLGPSWSILSHATDTVAKALTNGSSGGLLCNVTPHVAGSRTFHASGAP